MEERVELDPTNKPGVTISVMGSMSSGSLHESRNVIQVLRSRCDAGDYNHLAPFITSARLLAFKNKINSYLGLPEETVCK